MPPDNRVVTLTGTTRRTHEHVSHAALAAKLARLLDYEFAGEYDGRAGGNGHVYFVPDETLVAERARHLGIGGPRDLFGGVTPSRLAATKAITHVLAHPAAAAPRGWPRGLAERLRGVVLDGYTAFSADDARRAGLRLLDAGAVRVKPAQLLGGIGQAVAVDVRELDAALAVLDPGDVGEHGVVIERNIDAPAVFSIGEVHADALALAYWGVQREVENHSGLQVYGGSDLHFVRGRMADLLGLELAPSLRVAIRQALAYDAAVDAVLDGFFASRRNYDVLQGVDASGNAVSGVLEQSWRIGGASPAEIAALQAFKSDPALRSARASSHEVYGPLPSLPAHAEVHYDGTDAHAGRLCKFSVIEREQLAR